MNTQPMKKDVDNPKVSAFCRGYECADGLDRFRDCPAAAAAVFPGSVAVNFPEHYVDAAADTLTSISTQRVNQLSSNDPVVLSQKCRADHAWQLRNWLATLQDNHPFAGFMNAVEDGQAQHALESDGLIVIT